MSADSVTKLMPGDLGCYDDEYVASRAERVRRWVHGYFRARVDGLENLPSTPFLGVGNHSGATLIPDTFVWLTQYAAGPRRPPLLTLSQPLMFSAYPARLAKWLARSGAIRADARLALAALKEGFAVQVYPGGDFDACRGFRRRNDIVFGGHRGYVKLARKSGVPIVPVVSCGGHQTLCILWDGASLARKWSLDKKFGLRTFPLSLVLPFGIWLGPLPGYLPFPARINVRVLPPMEATGSVEAVDEKVREVMQTALREMAEERRTRWFG